MLYLVRKLNESIIINNNIKISVVEVNRGSVKLGITYPADEGVTVLREEIYLRIQEENMKALTAFNDADLKDQK